VKTLIDNTKAKQLAAEYVQTNFEEVLAKITDITREQSLKILDAHNKAMLEYEIDAVANKIRSDIGDNIGFEIFMSDLYNEFSTNQSPCMAEKIIGKLQTSKYYKNVPVVDKNRFRNLLSKTKMRCYNIL
jgi:hypothetical protein